jgi:thioesterase domain-containing protein
MSPLSPDVEPERLSATAHTFHEDVYERLKALELQLTLEHKRQRDQTEEELHKLRQQLATTVREQQQQHQTTLATLRETVEELRKEVAEALHHLSQDVDRVAQHGELQMSRAIERLRNELLEALFARDQTTVKRHLLGELFIMLGKNLQEASKGDAS